MCSKMRFVSVVATSREALRFLTTKSRRSSADLAARWIWKSLTPARKNTLSTPGSAANRCAKEPMRGRALGCRRTEMIACSGRAHLRGQHVVGGAGVGRQDAQDLVIGLVEHDVPANFLHGGWPARGHDLIKSSISGFQPNVIR